MMSVSRHRTDRWIKNSFVDVSHKELFGPVAEHWHEFYEIELIISGSGTYNIDGIDYDIARGSLFLMSPSSFHHINFTSDTKIINLMFVPDVGDRDFLCGLFGDCPHITMKLSDTDIDFMAVLTADMVKNSYIPYLTASLNCLLGKLLLLNSPDAPALQNAQMKYALLYIQNHFRDKITLEDAAEVAHYSRNYFGNKFKEYVGMTFKAYLAELRFSLALKMLTRTAMPTAEICYSCGFTDYSNFMYSFKKRYGMTPGKYRKCHGAPIGDTE